MSVRSGLYSYGDIVCIRPYTNLNKQRFVVMISLLAIFTQQFFFSVAGLIGFEYGGAEESPIYVRYVIVVFIAITTAFAASYIKKPRLTSVEVGFYLFFALLLINHLIWVLLDPIGTSHAPENLIFFLSMGITGFMAARVIQVFDAFQSNLGLEIGTVNLAFLAF
jgi:hypothetical protein